LVDIAAEIILIPLPNQSLIKRIRQKILVSFIFLPIQKKRPLYAKEKTSLPVQLPNWKGKKTYIYDHTDSLLILPLTTNWRRKKEGEIRMLCRS